MRDERSVSNDDVTVIPSQFQVTKQILLHLKPFRDLKLNYVGSRQAEQLSSRSHQRLVATVEESVLKTEMAGLESQEEDAPKRILFFKPMSWLGQTRPHRRDESWSASLYRHSSPRLWALRSPSLRRSLSRLQEISVRPPRRPP